MTFVAYHFGYLLRHLLNRLINLRMIAVSEGRRSSKGRPEARAERDLSAPLQ